MSLYRLLLLAFPRRVRREFGDEMARLFESQRRAAREAGDGFARFWISAVADAVVHGTAERLALAAEHLRSSMHGLAGWRLWMHGYFGTFLSVRTTRPVVPSSSRIVPRTT